jgi:homoserine dehydrogenase
MRADLALIGFGHVGRRFVRLLEESRQALTAEDLDWRIVSIATRRHGTVVDPGGVDGLAAAGRVEGGRRLGAHGAPSTARTTEGGNDATLAIDALAASDARLRVVVETTTLTIADGRPAIDHVERGLRAGCDVVTANKGPAAFAFRSLAGLARQCNRSFLFEGAVMDGVPVFNLVREAMPAVRILGFRGVVNSTTAHILTALEQGEPYDEALARMQAAGIAEADPSLDVDGWDAAAKAAALANVLMDAGVTPHDVRRTGIGPDLAGRARAAIAAGRRLRLVASCTRGDRPVVEPIELPADDLLATLRGTGNALILRSDLLDEVAIVQPAGSLTHTAYALLSDLITIRRRAHSS